jgi:hypothetical protein
MSNLHQLEAGQVRPIVRIGQGHIAGNARVRFTHITANEGSQAQLHRGERHEPARYNSVQSE